MKRPQPAKLSPEKTLDALPWGRARSSAHLQYGLMVFRVERRIRFRAPSETGDSVIEVSFGGDL